MQKMYALRDKKNFSYPLKEGGNPLETRLKKAQNNTAVHGAAA